MGRSRVGGGGNVSPLRKNVEVGGASVACPVSCRCVIQSVRSACDVVCARTIVAMDEIRRGTAGVAVVEVSAEPFVCSKKVGWVEVNVSGNREGSTNVIGVQ